MKNPYTYPDRSKKARIAYLVAHESYHPMNSWNGGHCLSWDVKIHSADYTGKNGGKPCDYPVNSAFDDQWNEYVSAHEQLFYDVCADVFRSMGEDYRVYPGADDGACSFALNGRSSGHLVLTDTAVIRPPRAWKLFPMIWASRADYADWLAELSKEDLESFYKAVRCMDTDFTQERIRDEFNYQMAFYRSQWEEDLNAGMESAARDIEADRPDMYAGVVS